MLRLWKQMIALVVCALLMASPFSVAALAVGDGWRQDELIPTNWYYYENGKPVTGWIEDGGKWYYMQTTEDDANSAYDVYGVMLRDSFVYDSDGAAYYVDSDGAMVTGSHEVRNYDVDSEELYATCEFDADGRLLEGVAGASYGVQAVFPSFNYIFSPWISREFSGVRYYYHGGQRQSGWTELDGAMYYFDPETFAMAANGWQQIDGKWYLFQEDGALHTGAAENAGEQIALTAEGTDLVPGWIEADGNTYYLDPDTGAMTAACIVEADGWNVAYNGLKEIDGVWYVFDKNGEMSGEWGSTDPWTGYIDRYESWPEEAKETLTVPWAERVPPAIETGELTGDALGWFNNFYFNDILQDQMTNKLLASTYDDPAGIDLYALFYSGVNGGEPVSEDELAALAQVTEWEPEAMISKVTEEEMDGFLRERLGLGLEETEKIGLDKFIYLEDFDAYYNIHTDTTYAFYEADSGVRTEDGQIVLRMSSFYDIVYREVTLQETEGGYLFLSCTMVGE